MPLNKDNRIIVYVWFNKADGGEGVGHAALQTPNYFISLWPGKPSAKLKEATMFFEHRDRVVFLNYEETVEAEENRPPDFICCLYSLDVEKIHNKIKDVCPQIGNWSILGNTKFNRPNAHMSHSCSSLVYDLLIVGGIGNLTLIGLTVPAMPSPHNIFTIARRAKKYEIQRYSDSQRFDQEDGHVFNPHDEVSTFAIKQEVTQKCIIL